MSEPYFETAAAVMKAINAGLAAGLSHAQAVEILTDHAGELARGEVARDPHGAQDSRLPPGLPAPDFLERTVPQGRAVYVRVSHGTRELVERLAARTGDEPAEVVTSAVIEASTLDLAQRITRAFGLATQDAVAAHAAAGVPTVGREGDEIVRREPDGSKAVVARVGDPERLIQQLIDEARRRGWDEVVDRAAVLLVAWRYRAKRAAKSTDEA